MPRPDQPKTKRVRNHGPKTPANGVQKQTEVQFHSTPLEYVPYVPIKRRKRVADSDAPWRRLHWGAISEENLDLLVRYQEASLLLNAI
ncbi:hypothetical protein LTR17_002890 [Elasticomyces elasticus]|nr:hypothetical protein LTR17_002890 [Elasticomyces elasticus]